MSHAFSGSLPRLTSIDTDYEPVSDAGKAIRRLWANDGNYVRGTAADWLPVIRSALITIESECGEDGWGGAEERAVPKVTVKLVEAIAECLFTLLPRDTPAPDLIPESDGEICMSWVVDRDNVFSVSVGEHGKMNFAGRFGQEGARHGWQPVDASGRSALEVSLQEIAGYIRKLFPRPALRRAA